MTQIKICGITNKTEANIVNRTKPDYAGMIFAGGRHHVTFDQALELRKIIDINIPVVGVFLNAPIEKVVQLYQRRIIQIVQLHGNESENYVNRLKKRQIPIIQVFKPNQQSLHQTNADYYMLDSGNGSGIPLDWYHLRINDQKNLFLSGGLTQNNVELAIQTIHPLAVDVSSGAETSGKKDVNKVKDIVNIAHQN